MRERLFLSYSHKDREWHDRFRKAFGGGIYKANVEAWSDQDIPTGSNWRREIVKAITSARVALILLSRNFLSSEFIVNDELRSILRKHGTSGAEGVSIWLVPVGETTQQERILADLDHIHAAHDPADPLSNYNEEDRQKKVWSIVIRLLPDLKVLPDLSSRMLQQLKSQVEEALASVNTRLEEAIAPGDYTIVYRAQRYNKTVAVKALVPSLRREWIADDFLERATVADRVKSEAAIAVRDVVPTGDVKCVVMEYSDDRTLSAVLKQKRGLSPLEVANVLAQLADVASDLHAVDHEEIVGPIRPSHVHFDEETQKVQISLVHVANETLRSCRQRPTVLLDQSALTYLSPERYDGHQVNVLSDQYYLGLLGLELLSGRPPVEVSTFVGLEKKRLFFENPRAFFPDALLGHPDLSFVLAKALERAPEKRWPTMKGLARTLRQVAEGNVPDTVRTYVSASYQERIQGNTEFFCAFYESLCKSSPDVAKMFDPKKVEMKSQYTSLDRAIGYVSSFDRRYKPTPLDSQVASHRAYNLKVEHFEFFRRSFLETLSTKLADQYATEAWHAVLGPALTYMRDRLTAGSSDRQTAPSPDPARIHAARSQPAKVSRSKLQQSSRKRAKSARVR